MNSKTKNDYVPINTTISKKSHKELKEFIRTHKLKNMTLTYGFIIEIALLYLFDSINNNQVTLETLAEATIKGD